MRTVGERCNQTSLIPLAAKLPGGGSATPETGLSIRCCWVAFLALLGSCRWVLVGLKDEIDKVLGYDVIAKLGRVVDGLDPWY